MVNKDWASELFVFAIYFYANVFTAATPPDFTFGEVWDAADVMRESFYAIPSVEVVFFVMIEIFHDGSI